MGWGRRLRGRRAAGPDSILGGLGGQAREGGGVVPRHPGRRVECHRGCMAQQRHQVVEGLDLVELGVWMRLMNRSPTWAPLRVR